MTDYTGRYSHCNTSSIMIAALYFWILTGLQCSTAKAVRADKEKAGSGDFEGWAAVAILTQRPAAERQNCLQCFTILQQQWKPFGAIIVHIGTSNQPSHCLQCSAAEAVKASLISRGTLHCWGLKAGPCVRPTKQSVAVASSTVKHCRDVSSSALWDFPCGGPTNCRWWCKEK